MSETAINRRSLVNSKTVADYIGMHVESVQKFARAGTIPCYVIGPRQIYRFDLDEIDQWLEGLRNSTR